MQYDSAITKNEIMPFAATWMNLGTIIQSEVSPTEKDKYRVTSCVCGTLKMIQMSLWLSFLGCKALWCRSGNLISVRGQRKRRRSLLEHRSRRRGWGGCIHCVWGCNVVVVRVETPLFLKPLTPCGKEVSEELLRLSGGQFSPIIDQDRHKIK